MCLLFKFYMLNYYYSRRKIMKINGLEPYEFLKKRGLIYQTTDEERLKELLNGKPITFYLGIDPTADSIHLGHLCSLRTFRFLQEAGHQGILVIGGATAAIGDPSGRTDLRSMLGRENIDNNLNQIKRFSERFIKTDGERPAIILNNNDWMKNFSYVDFKNVSVYKLDVIVHITNSCKRRYKIFINLNGNYKSRFISKQVCHNPKAGANFNNNIFLRDICRINNFLNN